jgi:hypothetical protein
MMNGGVSITLMDESGTQQTSARMMWYNQMGLIHVIDHVLLPK